MSSKIVLLLEHGPGNPRNSEGSFATLADGRIMFAYARYYGDSWADEATAAICARFSDDGGKTWTRRDRLLVDNEGRQNVMSVSLLHLQDGRLAMFYLRKNHAADCSVRMRTSCDDAATWSRPILCSPPPGYFCVNNDRVIQLSSGRLVVPAACHRSKRRGRRPDEMAVSFDQRGIAMFFISDDGGRSWRESLDWWACPVRNGTGLQEPGAVEHRDGSLYAWCRTDLGCQYEMRSRDDGDTWSPPRPSPFMSPASPLSMKRIPATGDLLAVWNDHSGRLAPAARKDRGYTSSSWGRTPLVAAVSADEGKTWGHAKLIEKDPSRGFCYTAIHFAGDAVLLAYCCGGGKKGAVLQDACIRRISLKWLYEAP